MLCCSEHPVFLGGAELLMAVQENLSGAFAGTLQVTGERKESVVSPGASECRKQLSARPGMKD